MSKVLKRLYLGDVVKSFGTKQLRKLTTVKPLVSFTIDGTSYQADVGMTWTEWVNSDYNTVGAYVSDNNIAVTIYGGTHYLNNSNQELISANDVISAGEYLWLTKQDDSIVGTWILNPSINERPPSAFTNIEGTFNSYNGVTNINGIYSQGSTKYPYVMIDGGDYDNCYYVDSTSLTAYNYTLSGNYIKQNYLSSYRIVPASEFYRTITITGGSDINNETFKTWLKANATKQ